MLVAGLASHQPGAESQASGKKEAALAPSDVRNRQTNSAEEEAVGRPRPGPMALWQKDWRPPFPSEEELQAEAPQALRGSGPLRCRWSCRHLECTVRSGHPARGLKGVQSGFNVSLAQSAHERKHYNSKPLTP